MQARSVITVTLIMLSQIVTAARASDAEEPGVISKEAYALCGLSIGDSEAKAQEVLGKPTSLYLQPSPTFGEREVEMTWPGVEASFLDSELVNLKVNSAKCGNPDGIAVDAPVERAFALLGNVKAEDRDDGAKRYRYWLEGTDCYFFVVVRDGQIVELELWFDYT